MKTRDFIWVCLLIGGMLFGCISCSSDKDEPEVEPAPKEFFEIEKQGYNISHEAQTIDVQIHTNMKVKSATYGEDGRWISVVNVLQDGDYLTYRVSVKENTSESKRTGSLSFSPASGTGTLESNTVVIVQAGTAP